MIFQHTAKWVLDRSPHTDAAKTQTRRPAKHGDIIITVPSDPHDRTIVAVERNKRLLYEVGRTYAIQPGRGVKEIGRFRLVSIASIPSAGIINAAEASAEGFKSPQAFREIWSELYGRAALEQPCYALTMELVK